MPVLTPFELWQQTGRDLHPGDLPAARTAKGAEYVLPMTHEETVTFHARELQSYKQLPQLLYHFSIEGARRAAPAGRAAAPSRVHHEGRVLVRPRRGRVSTRSFERTARRTSGSSSAAGSGLRRRGGAGMMGGKESIDFLAPSGSGENTLVTCENGDFAADLEVARGVPRAPEFPEPLDAPAEVETPGVTTCEALAEFLVDRRRRDVEGDAGHEARRHRRARARPRRRPARARRSSLRALGGDYAARNGRRDPRGVRRRAAARSGRSGSRAR